MLHNELTLIDEIWVDPIFQVVRTHKDQKGKRDPSKARKDDSREE